MGMDCEITYRKPSQIVCAYALSRAPESEVIDETQACRIVDEWFPLNNPEDTVAKLRFADELFQSEIELAKFPNQLAHLLSDTMKKKKKISSSHVHM
jgi:hypothetical protein